MDKNACYNLCFSTYMGKHEEKLEKDNFIPLMPCDRSEAFNFGYSQKYIFFPNRKMVV